MTPRLPEGQIAAQHGDSGFADRRGKRNEKWRTAVRACAVGEDETVSRSSAGLVEKSHNRGISEALESRYAGSCHMVFYPVKRFSFQGSAVFCNPPENACRHCASITAYRFRDTFPTRAGCISRNMGKPFISRVRNLVLKLHPNDSAGRLCPPAINRRRLEQRT
jgi:hypothetical protein